MNERDCESFEQWLDEGADPARAPALLGHELRCPRCAAALEAMAAVDAWLAPPVTAPDGFTDAIMARVARNPRALGLWVHDDLPWWLLVLQQPAMVVAVVVAALVTWKTEALLSAVTIAASWIARGSLATAVHFTLWNPRLPLDGASLSAAFPLLTLSIGLGLAPLLVLGALTLANWIAACVSRLTRAA